MENVQTKHSTISQVGCGDTRVHSDTNTNTHAHTEYNFTQATDLCSLCAQLSHVCPVCVPVVMGEDRAVWVGSESSSFLSDVTLEE